MRIRWAKREFCSGERVCEVIWGGGGRWKAAAAPREGSNRARQWLANAEADRLSSTDIYHFPGGEITSACTTTVSLPRGILSRLPSVASAPVRCPAARSKSPPCTTQASRSYSSLTTYYTGHGHHDEAYVGFFPSSAARRPGPRTVCEVSRDIKSFPELLPDRVHAEMVTSMLAQTASPPTPPTRSPTG